MKHSEAFINKKPKIQILAEFLVFWGLVWIGFSNLSQKDPSFGKLDHVINPMTPGVFCAKNVVFGRFGAFEAGSRPN